MESLILASVPEELGRALRQSLSFLDHPQAPPSLPKRRKEILKDRREANVYPNV